MTINMFPLGIAKGAAFCNRIAERSRLSAIINSGHHGLIMSPRRYGKSSLVLYTLNELQIPYIRLDLFVTTDEQKIVIEILDAVKKIIMQLGSFSEQIICILKEYINKLKLKLIIGTDGVNLQIIPSADSDAALNIRSGLNSFIFSR